MGIKMTAVVSGTLRPATGPASRPMFGSFRRTHQSHDSRNTNPTPPAIERGVL